VPTVVSVIVWPLFLVGLGLLTYRLSRSLLASFFCLVVAAITDPYLTVFAQTGSEVLFLTVLVYLLIIVPDPTLRKVPYYSLRLFATALLAGVLLLTRYTGMFFFIVLVGWWGYWGVKQGTLRRVSKELVLFAVAAVPFLFWLLRNLRLSGSLFGGGHTGNTNHTFIEGVIAVVKQSLWVIFPAIRPTGIFYEFGFGGTVVFLLLVGLLLLLLWHYRINWDFDWPKHPLILFVIIYYALYTVAQPVFTFEPMDMRDATTVLSLLQPWLIVVLFQVASTQVRIVLGVYVLVNLGCLLLLVSNYRQQIPNWVAVNPIAFHDLANRIDDQNTLRENGMPYWLIHKPGRLQDLSIHHPNLLQYIDSVDEEHVIVSNALHLFTDPIIVEDMELPTPILFWLAEGSCDPPTDVLLVIFDWDQWQESRFDDGRNIAMSPSQLRTAVEQKCPDAAEFSFEHSVVYYLEP
jgi:hypothetical protein